MKDLHTDFFNNLRTLEETSFFIKNMESFLSGNVTLDSIYKSYPFLKKHDVELVKKLFPKIRTELISRKKVKIYTAITVSSSLIEIIYNVLKKYSGSDLVLEPLLDLSIVGGIRFNLDGKIFDLTVERLNSLGNI